MLSHKTVRRYTKAFFQIARETGTLEMVAEDLAVLSALVRVSPDLVAFLGNYMVGAEKRQALLVEIFDGKVQPLTMRFIRFLEAKKRLGLLVAVCDEFGETLARSKGIVKATLTSAYSLKPAQVSAIGEAVRRPEMTRVRVTPLVDPALLGGFELQVEDRVYDLSLRTQLRNLRRKMMAS
jgi:F-type H+-transporting ATPase subunit delta